MTATRAATAVSLLTIDADIGWIFSIFGDLPLGRPGNSGEKTQEFCVFLVFVFAM
jgi:hypothetical protein